METGELPPELGSATNVEKSFSPPEVKKVKRTGLADKLSNLIANNEKESWFMSWNLSLFMWEVLRDSSHISEGAPGAIHGISQGKPIATEGMWGFVDQHIGDTVEVLELFYLSRIPVSLVAKVVEMTTDKKVDPRVKLGASLLLSTAIVSGLELSGAAGGIPDPYDLVGVAAGAIWASVGYEVIDYLFKERETPLFDQWAAKISTMAKSMEGIDKKVLTKLNAWMRTPAGSPPPEIAIAESQFPTTNANLDTPQSGSERL